MNSYSSLINQTIAAANKTREERENGKQPSKGDGSGKDWMTATREEVSAKLKSYGVSPHH